MAWMVLAVWLAMLPCALAAQQIDLGHEEAAEHERGVGLDEVNRLVALGDIRPLAEVVAVALRRVPGELIDADLRLRHERYVYEVGILRDGRPFEIHIDAVTLEYCGRE